jgi:tetratricopeptide (TPR) repeat protein
VEAEVSRLITVVVSILSCCAAVSLHAEENTGQTLDREYQTAVADYNAGRYQDAAGELEKLLPYSARNSAVHELLGMVYVVLSEQNKAIDQLKTAVALKPDWAEARTNLGSALLQSGRTAPAEEQFRKALSLEPSNYIANHNLADFYLQSGKVAEALPLLERAHAINRGAYDNSYDLALAQFRLGHLDASRAVATETARKSDTGELHNLLGHIEEKQGQYVAAAKDYETATHLDPSEDNFFDWGCEMLLHRTFDPAIAIFQEAARRYPKSLRIKIGLGLSLYSRGRHDEAVVELLGAAEMAPDDTRCYVFLSQIDDSSPIHAEDVMRTFRNYAALQPSNAVAQYDYAMSLWKVFGKDNATFDRGQVESLLLKAIALNDSMADAHEQLGNLYADQHEYVKAAPQYRRALELDPDLAEAHYRLGTVDVHLDLKNEAQKEFAVYQKLRARQLDEDDRKKAQVQQFIYSETAINQPKP